MLGNTIYNESLYNKAQAHHKLMCSLYASETRNSIQNSKVYRDSFDLYEYDNENGILPEIIFVKAGTTDALMQYADDKWCLLNFASFRHPGGGYLKGSKAQEEMLCHESNLYNVIGDQKFAPEYKKNCSIQNNGFYTDFAIYSPDIIFHRNGKEVKADVITCAAPNWREINKNTNGKSEETIKKELNYQILRSRIEFIFNIAIDNDCDNLILGAWGCGVFQQDPKEVATLFKEFLSLYTFKKVIIAIPDDANMDKFKEILMYYDRRIS